MVNRALIFGVGGMDGSYLADLLLEKGYEVHGTSRRSSVDNLSRVRHLDGRLSHHGADLTDPASILRVINLVRPVEIYNMADQDHVGWSHDTPGYSIDVTVGGVATILEIIRQFDPAVTRFFQPISATVFGDYPEETPQTLKTPLNPQSPYACAKAHTWHLCRYYRERYGMYVSCGVLYNHDSPRRGPDYLLQKIARGEDLTGDLSQVVDVGHAKDFVKVMWSQLQGDTPTDELVGTGYAYTIKSLVNYKLAGFHGIWRVDEPARCLTPEKRPWFSMTAPDVLRDICQGGR